MSIKTDKQIRQDLDYIDNVNIVLMCAVGFQVGALLFATVLCAWLMS